MVCLYFKGWRKNVLRVRSLERGPENGNYCLDYFWSDCGVIAKLIMPGRDGGGFILTCILGVVGAVVGGWLATMFGIGGDVSGFNLHSFLVAVVGAIVVLGVFRLVRRD